MWPDHYATHIDVFVLEGREFGADLVLDSVKDVRLPLVEERLPPLPALGIVLFDGAVDCADYTTFAS